MVILRTRMRACAKILLQIAVHTHTYIHTHTHTTREPVQSFFFRNVKKIVFHVKTGSVFILCVSITIGSDKPELVWLPDVTNQTEFNLKTN